jgi:hypothetical protein
MQRESANKQCKHLSQPKTQVWILADAQLLFPIHSATLEEAVPLLESFPGALARTEKKLADILAADEKAQKWIQQARQHYCQETKTKGEPPGGWGSVDFDALVPVIDR